ncbi:twin-arginine translocase TatA/TatE family subunit [Gelidibacter salicanalis]|uniref:Sec-independent protein translocase protein TatA n=1 Tax=Gelidibacter salicanalis TaxID=291193 RepID=A0A5C7AKL7_9FLAO|nr:twin-arginine translocase TatA/TatE family subunit [Gelidibacter salicanalis]TXE09350.1 twin-arginine translocase TatA/TatE family subunit [Gelidibacter salicanalis]
MILHTTFLFIGTTEIMFILFIVVMVFGADKVPDIAKGMGKGMRSLRDATNDLKSEITKTSEKHGIDPSEYSKSITDEIQKVKDEVEDSVGSIKRKL